MARPNRSARAEARRRYRAALAAQSGEELPDEYIEEEEPEPAAVAMKDGKRDPLAPDPANMKPVGFMSAFGAAYRRVHYRDDLRAFFPLIFRSNAIWPVAVICALGLAIVMVRRDPHDGLFQISYSMILNPYPLPLLPAMIAGFLAPRASWLAGGIAGLIQSMTFLTWLCSPAYPHIDSAGHLLGFQAIPASQVPGAFLTLASWAVPASALLAAVAAWYKRFLKLTGPAAQMERVAQKNAGKGSARRSATAKSSTARR